MTEQQLLDNLLGSSPKRVEAIMEAAHQTTIGTQAPPLTPKGELALLRAASAVGPVTLAEQPTEVTNSDNAVQSIGDFVRRYPIQTALVAGLAAYMLARRRR